MWRATLTKRYRAQKLCEAAEGETIVYAHIGRVSKSRLVMHALRAKFVSESSDPKPFEAARAGIPVTVQRRFDVYPDVSKGT